MLDSLSNACELIIVVFQVWLWFSLWLSQLRVTVVFTGVTVVFTGVTVVFQV